MTDLTTAEIRTLLLASEWVNPGMSTHPDFDHDAWCNAREKLREMLKK